MAEIFTNNAVSLLASGVGNGDLTATVATGEGSKFPSPTGGDFFRVTFIKKSTGDIEVAYCTARSGDILTISRGEEGTTALNLSAGDIVSNRPTAGFFNSLTVTDLAVQSGAYNFAVDSGLVNAYVLTLSPVPATLTDGMILYFYTSNNNTAASTLDPNGLGPISILRPDGSALKANDIRDDQFNAVQYLNSGPHFRLLSLPYWKMAELANVNTWAQQQLYTPVTLTYGANIAWDLDTGPLAIVTLSDTTAQLDNPTNMRNGGRGDLMIKQDATGGRLLTFGTAFKFPNGYTPGISSTAGAVDLLSWRSDGNFMYCNILHAFG